nr:PREDICTED: motile sperm domain-containing protein 3 [Latimeria chalumnae]|eukprot:XP_006012263.2 PREDICTED: motile sperm domain-containing protein 3 [Latimeria chalumnae]
MHRRGPPTPGEDHRPDRELEGGRRAAWEPVSLSSQQFPAIEGKLPVFAFPPELTFYSDDQASYKQVLTLYNPYGFVLSFKGTRVSNSFKVDDATAYFLVQLCVLFLEGVIRHKDVASCHYGNDDKFRIEVSVEGSRRVWGWKVVPAVLQPTKKQVSPPDQRMLPQEPFVWSSSQVMPTCHGQSPPASLFILCILVGIVCIVFLMLPLQDEASTFIPPYLHVTVIQKLVAAYVLGKGGGNWFRLVKKKVQSITASGHSITKGPEGPSCWWCAPPAGSPGFSPWRAVSQSPGDCGGGEASGRRDALSLRSP